MKKLMITLILAMFVSSCTLFGNNTDKTSVCDQNEFSNSIICKKASENGYVIEDINNLILDINRLAMLDSSYDCDMVLGYIEYARTVINFTEDLTYAKLVSMLTDEADKIKAFVIIDILQTRFNFYNVDLPILSEDRVLLNTALNGVENQVKTYRDIMIKQRVASEGA